MESVIMSIAYWKVYDTGLPQNVNVQAAKRPGQQLVACEP
jgi:hypothetical protein